MPGQLTRHLQRRLGGHLLLLLVAATTPVLISPADADRVLHFTVTSGSIAGVRTAAVNVDGMVVMRLRATNDDGLQAKAEMVASRLTDLALTGLRPEQVRVEQVQGQWAVTGDGKLIVTADADTATASGLPPKDLCESWRARLVEVLREPYLCVVPHELLVVPYNEKRLVRFGGTVAAQPRAESMAPAIAQLEPGLSRAVAHGRGTGTTVVVVEAGELQHAITVEVKKWAAQIDASASMIALPGGIGRQMLEPAIRNAALSGVRSEPHAIVRVTDLAAAETGYTASIRAGGAQYLPVARKMQITPGGALGPIPFPATLLISNYPEKVDGIGALMRQSLAPREPARLMWHHKNYAGRPIVVTVRLLNAGARPAKIRLGWAEAGPDPDEIFVGYNAMARYWENVRRNAGFVAHIPAQSAFETSALRLGHHDVVSGLLDLVADEGEGLYIEVLARDPEDAPAGFGSVPGEGDQLSVTPYAFPATIDAEVDYEVGGRYGHLSIGREDVPNEHGLRLAGAYGISHRVRVNASNPTAEPAMLEIALRAGGGVARSVALVDGAINSSGILSAGHEQLLDRRGIAPGQSIQIPVEIIPTAGSNLPFTVVVRARRR